LRQIWPFKDEIYFLGLTLETTSKKTREQQMAVKIRVGKKERREIVIA